MKDYQQATLYIILETREDKKSYLSRFYQTDDGIDISFSTTKKLGIRMEFFDARKTMDYIKLWNNKNMEDDCIIDCHYALIKMKKE